MGSSNTILTPKHINLNGINCVRCEPFGAYVIHTSVRKHFVGANKYNIAKYGVLPSLKYERYANAVGVKSYCELVAAKLTTKDILVGNLWNFIHYDETLSTQSTKIGALSYRKYISSNDAIHTDLMNMCKFAYDKNISFNNMFIDANSLAFRMYIKEYITFGTIIAMATITDVLEDKLKLDPLIAQSIAHIKRVSDLFTVNHDMLMGVINECKEMFNLTQ